MQNTTDDEPKPATRVNLFFGPTLAAALFVLCALIAPPFSAQAQQARPTDLSSSRTTQKRTTQKKSGASPVKSRPLKSKASETLIDASIPDDIAVDKMLEPYSARVRALETVIGKLEGELAKGRIGAGSLGNFVTDGLRAQASVTLKEPVLLTVTNGGGLRRNSIGEGELRVRDIFELLPFENALIRVDLTGEQVIHLLSVILTERDAQSGARIRYRMSGEDRPEFVSATLVDAGGSETTIETAQVYSVVTIDYLYGLGSGKYSILRQGQNMKPLGITMRDAMLAYVKSETAAGRAIHAKLDGRFQNIGSSPSREGITP